MRDYDAVDITDAATLREWLERHHRQTTPVYSLAWSPKANS